MRKTDVPEPSLEDATLVARARSSDKEAFGALVGRYEKALESILLPFTTDRDAARDLVQEAVLRAYKNLDRYREDRKFSTWFFRIGVNLAISARRRAQLEHKLQEPGERRGPAERIPITETPLEAVLAEEDKERLRTALGALPQRYREVLKLRYTDELGVKEIAQKLDTTANTISIVLFRAKQRLKEDLEES